MSKYEPQVGDRVRCTHWDGTVLEGVIAGVRGGWAESESGLPLYDNDHPERTVLLERPFALNTAPGTVYGAPDSLSRRVVRVAGEWLGNIGGDFHWYEDEDIAKLITEAGWVEFNLDGSRKSE